MKSIIESSIYLFLMALICGISVQFILMNERVTKVNEVASYIENYTEANGICETKEVEIDGKKINKIIYYKYDNANNIVKATEEEINNKDILTFPKIQDDKIEALKNITKDYGFKIDFKYISPISNYGYMDYTVTYYLGNSLLGFGKTHTYSGLARFSLAEQGV